MSEGVNLIRNRNLDYLHSPESVNFNKLSGELAETGKIFYSRGWVLGTSGNFSAVTSWRPLRVAISSTGLDKGSLTPAHFVEIDGVANVIRGDGRPSTEVLLHLAIIDSLNAGAVLHTHSVWSTILSRIHASQGGIDIEGYEMLNEHREWLPILGNSQDMTELSQNISAILRTHPGIHGFLLRGHGLYGWGASLLEAKRHIEVLEFLMEVLVRSNQATTQRIRGI
jgi:methylthioribulose-1-phosphate dehydratase